MQLATANEIPASLLALKDVVLARHGQVRDGKWADAPIDLLIDPHAFEAGGMRVKISATDTSHAVTQLLTKRRSLGWDAVQGLVLLKTGPTDYWMMPNIFQRSTTVAAGSSAEGARSMLGSNLTRNRVELVGGAGYNAAQNLEGMPVVTDQ